MRKTTLAFLLATVGSPALALDFGNGFSTTGEIELEHSKYMFSNYSYFTGDVTLSWRSSGSGAIGYGADLTILHFRQIKESEGSTAYRGGLVVTTGFGDFTIGAPRRALSTVLTLPELGTNRMVNLEFNQLRWDSFHPLLSEDTELGLAFTGTSGNLTYGASAHQFEGGKATADTVQIAASYIMGSTTFMGGVQRVTGFGPSNQTALIFGMLYDRNKLTLGLELSNFANDNGQSFASARLHAGYDITDAFTVLADITQIDPGFSGFT